MPDVWYSTVESGTRLTQGDLIFDCPLVGWKDDVTRFEGAGETEVLKQSVDAFKADTVVMTQACDLEHEKVINVVLRTLITTAPHLRADWYAHCKHCGTRANGFRSSITRKPRGIREYPGLISILQSNKDRRSVGKPNIRQI